jgi:hypothetical protein
MLRLAHRICGSLSVFAHPFTIIAVLVLVFVVPRIVVLVFAVIRKIVVFVFVVVRMVLKALFKLLLHCLGFRRRGVLRGMPRVPIHGSLTLLTRVVDRLRLLRCYLAIDNVWWEGTEALDICTVPVVRGEGLRWIPPRRWDRVSELTLVVDLDRWGIPFSSDGFTETGIMY